MLDDRLRFDLKVPPGGYAWWYFDAESPDRTAAITIIAFIGSVFSPYYAWAGRTAPENHCALNVAIYGPSPRWTMTERSRKRVALARERFDIGASALSWRDGELTIAIDERAAPFPFPVRGEVRVRPLALTERTFLIDAHGRHRWRPLAPRARFDVTLSEPRLIWSGDGYFDSNDGDEPLEDAFSVWNWARLHPLSGDTVVLYDTEPRTGAAQRIAIAVNGKGEVVDARLPPLQRADQTAVFRMDRRIGGDAGSAPKIIRTLEDAPFYSRSLVETSLGGQSYRGFHESLSGDRLRSPVVRAMLPFRMPRHDL